MCNDKSRHVYCRHNATKHLLSNEIIFIDYVKSNENTLNLLTKSLLRELLYNLLKEIGLKSLKYEII